MNTRRTALALLALTALAALNPRPAAAEIYRPWCVQYVDKSGATSCAFTSFEQCMETARGGGGSCMQNPWYLQYGERGQATDARQGSGRGKRR
jgi:uncharacterized protein DUF3551